MRRRNAGACGTTIMASKNASVEGGKTIKRTVSRRYAITKYSQIPIRSMKSLRKYVRESRPVESENYIENPPSTEDYDSVVFDEDDSIDMSYEGSQEFLAILNMYVNEQVYQSTKSETHRSIIRSTILNDIKNQGFRFMKKSSLHHGRFFLVDGLYLLSIVKRRLAMAHQKKPDHAHSA